MSIESSMLTIRPEDLIDKSLYIEWNQTERNTLFAAYNSSIKNLSIELGHDQTTLYQIRAGQVIPSTIIYLHLLEHAGIRPDLYSLKLRSRNHNSVSLRSNILSPELIGLLHSDGHMKLTGSSIQFQFCNQKIELIQRFTKLIKKTFDCEVKIRKDLRDNTYYAFPPCVVARIIAKKIGWKTTDYTNLNFDKEEVPSYLSGLFDGDGSIHIYKNSKITVPVAKITTNSLYHANHIRFLLQKVDIFSRVDEETSNNHQWFNVKISRQKEFLKFIKLIRSSHPEKKKRIELYLTHGEKLFSKKGS